MSSTILISGELPAENSGVEKFACRVYSSKYLSHNISYLRWQLLSTKNMQEEMLPPARATLPSHLLRTNYIYTRDKSYTTATPALPRLEDNGWSFEEIMNFNI